MADYYYMYNINQQYIKQYIFYTPRKYIFQFLFCLRQNLHNKHVTNRVANKSS